VFQKQGICPPHQVVLHEMCSRGVEGREFKVPGKCLGSGRFRMTLRRSSTVATLLADAGADDMAHFSSSGRRATTSRRLLFTAGAAALIVEPWSHRASPNRQVGKSRRSQHELESVMCKRERVSDGCVLLRDVDTNTANTAYE
jgi:hypothetical protein